MLGRRLKSLSIPSHSAVQALIHRYVVDCGARCTWCRGKWCFGDSMQPPAVAPYLYSVQSSCTRDSRSGASSASTARAATGEVQLLNESCKRAGKHCSRVMQPQQQSLHKHCVIINSKILLVCAKSTYVSNSISEGRCGFYCCMPKQQLATSAAGWFSPHMPCSQVRTARCTQTHMHGHTPGLHTSTVMDLGGPCGLTCVLSMPYRSCISMAPVSRTQYRAHL